MKRQVEGEIISIEIGAMLAETRHFYEIKEAISIFLLHVCSKQTSLEALFFESNFPRRLIFRVLFYLVHVCWLSFTKQRFYLVTKYEFKSKFRYII